MSDSLTIFLTLKDRPAFTRRWMKYMNDARCPYKIFIADGGQDQSIEKHLRNNDNYQYLNYEYIRYPYDSTCDDYYTKYNDVVNRVTTPYILQADNDDFFILDRIQELMNVLDSSTDVVGVRGDLVNFTVYSSGDTGTNNLIGSHYTAVKNRVPSIDHDSSIERIQYLCKHMSQYDYYSNWYCIFRTEVVRDIWNKIILLPIKEIIIIEILCHILLLEKGKILVLDFPYYLRQGGTSQFGDIVNKNNKFIERCFLNNSFSLFNIAINEFLVDYTDHDKKVILISLAEWFQQFVSNTFVNTKRVNDSLLYKLGKRIQNMAYIGKWITAVYYYFINMNNKSVYRQVINVRQVENYIIE